MVSSLYTAAKLVKVVSAAPSEHGGGAHKSGSRTYIRTCIFRSPIMSAVIQAKYLMSSLCLVRPTAVRDPVKAVCRLRCYYRLYGCHVLYLEISCCRVWYTLHEEKVYRRSTFIRLRAHARPHRIFQEVYSTVVS